MRVVISGVRGDVTSCVIGELARRGHELAEGAQHPAADALVHVAGSDADVATVLGRAQRAGTARVVVICFISSKATPGTDALLIEAAGVVGSATTGATRRRFAGPVIVGVAGRRNLVQVIHHDDLARFTVDALEHPQWSGRVNLAADDAVELRDVAAILGKRYIELNPALHGALRHLLHQPGIRHAAPADRLLDTTRLREFGFTPAFTGRDCVTDFHHANRQYLDLGARRVAIPWRFPWVPAPPPRHDGPQRHSANDSGAGGEFDTTVDPRWPEFTCANIAEAFPGPMTPLSLELAMEAMRATGVLAADIVAMKGEIRRAVTEEHVGSFGHTIYVNLTVSRAASSMLPAAGPSAWRDLLFGNESGVDATAAGKIGLLDMAARLPKIITLFTTTAAETRRIEAEARDQQREAAYYRYRSDDELYSQLRCVRDEVASSWAVAALGSAGVVPIMALIERLGGKRLASQFKGGVEHLASAGLIRGTYDLAGRAAADRRIMAILRATREAGAEAALRNLRADQPEFAARVEAVVAEYGHRGPNETELSSPVFADTPARLLDAVAKLADSQERRTTSLPEMNAGLRLLAHLGAGFQQSRERARDAAVRYTHNYRLIARELGSRLAASGVIEEPGDIFYLVRDELTQPSADLRTRISRRKAERVRLTQHRPPVHFVQRWEPRRDTPGELRPGESVTGIAASAGLAKGRVRVLAADSIDELQAGEVLIAECTDTGWTPFFSYAAAVVVDTGAEMSHAAVIAREFGIPCVVGAVAASRILRTGQVVEVDGSAGRITRVE